MNPRLQTTTLPTILLLCLAFFWIGCGGVESYTDDLTEDSTPLADEPNNEPDFIRETIGSTCDCTPSEYPTHTFNIDMRSGNIQGQGCETNSPVILTQSSQGWVYRIDMSAFSSIRVTTDALEPSGWSFHLSNSSTANGWGGDSGTTVFDSEAYLYSNTFEVFRGDNNGGGRFFSKPNLFNPDGDTLSFTVCNGHITYTSSRAHISISDPGIFQFNNDVWDAEANTTQDSYLWLGINRTVLSSNRAGSGIESVQIELFE